MTQSRQLAAIMFTDIVGYTALMGEDEQKAFELLKKNRLVQRPVIEKFNGRWLKEIGDGVLASFPTVSDAVYCALELQEFCKQEPDLNLRIGIHQGEVVFEGNDVFGDGVNIASRLEPLAPKGGILVSESVHRNIRNKPDINVAFNREEYLKGVRDPVRTYQVLTNGADSIAQELENATPVTKKSAVGTLKITFGIATTLLMVVAVLFFALNPTDSAEESAQAVTLEKSIAVLPFRDISPNNDQEWFSDGMMEAVLDHLVKIPGLKVISRTSVMQYKETVKTIPEIARELGVNYLLEGGVQVVGEDVRITAQLIDNNDRHLWSEQFDRPYKDVFSIQTEIAVQIAGTMEATIGQEVRERINRVPTNNLQAYNSYLIALENLSNFNLDRAWELFEHATELDPEFSEAYAAYGTYWYFVYTWIGHEKFTNYEIVDKSYSLLEQAVKLNPNNAYAHFHLGQLYCYALLDLKKADQEYRIAQELNPSNIYFKNPEFMLAVGRFQEALEAANLQKATDPQNPRNNSILPLYFTGRIAEAVSEADEGVESSNDQEIAMLPEFMYTAQRGYLWAGKHQEVVDLYERNPNVYTRVRTNAAMAYYKLGQQDKTDETIEHLKSITTGLGSPAYCLGLIYAQMGDREEAFKWLNVALEKRQGELYWLKYEPTWDPIRDDPRFHELVDKIGFP